MAACFSLLLFWLVPIMSPIHLSLLFVCVWIAEKEVQFEARDLLPVGFFWRCNELSHTHTCHFDIQPEAVRQWL